ncbi:15-hydroxyprostaglandin dehydrogenase [NAD(+)]-like [Dendronephthya gigantea]|uniref:15-hydroxyprostaglandin dehydrogenase [NAD(+)]-like n=1 Tax=Dendronephthya gigantea TaxID=151771 RepID=UPI001069B645|nr:15-hydroxyprostaglandin dehydrogenase [NAD(+)]-like [Dendronephthya gigantea]
MATFLECNVRHKKMFAEILSKVVRENGHLDILCNNAGIGPSSNDVENMVCVNLVSVIEGTLLATKIMDKNNGGRGGCIVNIASTAGLFYFPASNCAYLASKHGVVSFTRAYAKVAMKSGVRINCICPSFVDTDMSRTSALLIPEVKQQQQALGVQTVDDVAKGFIQLLNVEDKVGEAMRISFKNGIEYHTFPPDPILL